ncbi:hypothetical protein [Pararhodobacter oceanensis]|uniref:hypothetical protein n=1 Tax=Pararhodobacter oceanensis TaxID=2172121 RepID=UPI000E30A2D2|nr:hypothetical protein [Pararhodobacter oceanensis]
MSRPSPISRWLVRAGFASALALTLFFAVRLIMGAIYWNDPSKIDQTPAGWMPVGYVARSWEIPRDVLIDALDLASMPRRRRTLEHIAEDRGIPLDTLVTEIMAVIEHHREARRD